VCRFGEEVRPVKLTTKVFGKRLVRTRFCWTISSKYFRSFGSVGSLLHKEGKKSLVRLETGKITMVHSRAMEIQDYSLLRAGYAPAKNDFLFEKARHLQPSL
jgi:hypothetical protein